MRVSPRASMSGPAIRTTGAAARRTRKGRTLRRRDARAAADDERLPGLHRASGNFGHHPVAGAGHDIHRLRLAVLKYTPARHRWRCACLLRPAPPAAGARHNRIEIRAL